MERTFKLLEHEGWNERAPFYDEYTSRMTSHAIAPLLDAANVRSGARVLDVCCGRGTASAEAVRRGANVIGIDFSEEMIEVARSNKLGADFRVGDAEALPFTDQSFDCAICNFGILHLPEPERGMADAALVLVRGASACRAGSHRRDGPREISGVREGRHGARADSGDRGEWDQGLSHSLFPPCTRAG